MHVSRTSLSLTITILAATVLLSGCGDPVDRAYQDCLARIEAGISEAERDNGPGAQTAAAMSDFARSAGAAACGAMRDACRADPDGALCKTALDGMTGN